MTAFTPYWLSHISPRDRLRVGDKALQLAHGARHGFPVIPGIVVPSTALHACLQYTAWPYPLLADLADAAPYLERQNPRQLQAVATHLQDTIERASLLPSALSEVMGGCAVWNTPTLILRPSLAVNHEPVPDLHGVFDAHLCAAHSEAIAHGLKQVWKELFRARSLVFWHRLGISLQQVYLAVLIQPIHNAIASGDMTIHGSQVHIRATVGLGQAIAVGDVLPDEYWLDIRTPFQHEARIQPKCYQVCIQTAVPEAVGVPPAGAAVNRPSQPCWFTQAVDPSRHMQPALDASHLAQVIYLAERLSNTYAEPLRVGWTLPVQSHPSPDPAGSELQVVRLARWPVPISRAREAQTGVREAGNRPGEGVGLAAARGQAIASAWVASDADTPEAMPVGAVLVASSIRPDWLSWLHRASGIVTEQGGMTSHAAILARELGIPAVVGVRHVTEWLRSGDRIYLDGDRGWVRRLPGDESSLALGAEPKSRSLQSGTVLESAAADPPVSWRNNPPLRTQLWVNWGQTERIDEIAALPVEGVGLLRSEFRLRDRLPAYFQATGDRQWIALDIAQHIQDIAQAFFPRPVFYRSLDVRSHEYSGMGDRSQSEQNPILGLHGTLSYQRDPWLFDLEMAAIAHLHQAGLTNINLLLPFVRTVDEFIFCDRRLRQQSFPDPSQLVVWIMAEVPSVLFLLPDFAKAGIGGISIGSNDLTQLLLGIDRDQADLAIAYDSRHPAVLAAMRHLIETARRLNLPCSICGQAPSQYPDLIEQLVAWGITSISVSPDAVETSRAAIARAEAQHQ